MVTAQSRLLRPLSPCPPRGLQHGPAAPRLPWLRRAGGGPEPPTPAIPWQGSPSPAVPAPRNSRQWGQRQGWSWAPGHRWQSQGHGYGRSCLLTSRVPWATLAPEVWAGVGGCDATSPGSPSPWPGGPRKPTAPAAPSWERGSSCLSPATAAPLQFIYIPEKELATAASSSCGLWLRRAPSLCPQPCRSAQGPPSAAGRRLEELALCTGASAVRQVPLMPQVRGARPCPAAQPYLQQLPAPRPPPPRRYF